MQQKKVAISLYTGEYARSLELALSGEGANYRSYDAELFRAGYEAGAGKSDLLGTDLDVAWAAYQQQLLSWGVQANFQSDLTMTATLIVAWGDDEQLLKAAWRYARTLVADVMTIGGDDTVYDYFPDAMEALYQLCSLIGTNEAKLLYESAVRNAWEAKYSEIDEFDSPANVFVTWK